MTQVNALPIEHSDETKRKVALGVTAVFITQFVSFIFINARNIATPQMIAEFDGMLLFAWLIALPALSGSISTLLFGKLSDIYGRRAILLLCIEIFLLGLGLTTQSTSMAFLVAAAKTMLILGFSWLGVSGQIGVGVILLIISTIAWISFIQIEKQAEAPILDPQVFFNRTFMTATRWRSCLID